MNDYVLNGPEGSWFNTRTATQGREFNLGHELRSMDGRRFRYVRMGATAGVAGKLYQSEVPDADHDTLAVVSGTLGSRTISATNGADVIEANLYEEGYAVIEAAAGAGEGRMYKIDSHGELAASGTVEIPLAAGNGLRAALNTSDTVTLIKSPFADIIVHPSPPTAALVGVCVSEIPAAGFGWVQTRGPCAVLIDGTVVIGANVMASDGVDGAVEAAALTEGTPNTFITEIVGRVMEVAPTTGYGAIFLTID